MNFVEGEVILLNKPYRWTSFDLVKKVRCLVQKYCKVKKIKVGHAGTLDPLATGLLIICTGKATKEIEQFQGQEKEYIATLEVGKTTPSFDLETKVDKEYPTDHISKELVEDVLKKLTGDILQVPPQFSAKSLNGERAYVSARKGEKVELAPNKINISRIELLSFDLPLLKIRVVCSKGTYIRALARDIGFLLHSGAYLVALERTAIGNFKLSEALTIDEFENNLYL